MTNVLKIQNNYSWFISNDLKVKHTLWDCLRWRDRNYFHNRRYRLRLWDGYTEFFNLDNGRFLTGLLPEITVTLRKLKVKYTVLDQRKRVLFRHTSIDENYLNQWLPETWLDGDPASPITLHDYQVDFTNKAIKHHRGVIYSPTASGKTYILVSILKAIQQGYPTLILQNRKSLALQNYEEMCNWGFDNVGTLWGKSVKPNITTVACVQSIGKIEKLLPKIRILIVDEIHDMMSKLPKAVYRRMKSCDCRIALSATPFKFGEKDSVQKYFVKGFFGPVLKIKATKSGILTTKELQDRDILSPSRCIFYPIDKPQIPYDVYIDAVTNGIAESYYFHDVVTRLANTFKGRSLILVDRLAHGDSLHNLLPGSLWVQGKDNEKTRKKVIRELQKSSGNVIAIATQQIFNTGINVHIHNLLNAAGGKADHLIIQRMGRGLRTAKDKDRLNYYDFVFNINDYLLGHSKKRIKILEKEGHEVIVKEEIDF